MFLFLGRCYNLLMGVVLMWWALLYESMIKESVRSIRSSFGRVFNLGLNLFKSFNFFVDGLNVWSLDFKLRSKVLLD